jgi:hypothetical protein
MTVEGVTYLPLTLEKRAATSRLPLAAVWMRDSRDALRDSLLQTLMDNLDRYEAKA